MIDSPESRVKSNRAAQDKIHAAEPEKTPFAPTITVIIDIRNEIRIPGKLLYVLFILRVCTLRLYDGLNIFAPKLRFTFLSKILGRGNQETSAENLRIGRFHLDDSEHGALGIFNDGEPADIRDVGNRYDDFSF